MSDEATFDPDSLRKEFADYCSDVEPGIKAKAPKLNQLETLAIIGMSVFQAAKELKAEKAQQAARIAELEAQIAPVAPAVDAQPVAWMHEDNPRECISDLKKRDMIEHNGTPGKKAAEKYSLPSYATPVQIAAAQKPVGYAGEMPGTARGFTMAVFDGATVPVGSPLYASAPSEGLMTWQPIETAPKDGRMFLVWVDAVRFGEDDNGEPFEQDCSTSDFAEWRKCGDDGYVNYFAHPFADQEYATHWMPLPEAPAALSQHTGEKDG